MAMRAGEWVQVKSKAEILRSLDKSGRLENLPFMPQMFEYCGRRFKIYKRAHKTCDTVSPRPSGRHLSKSVHLDLRCDGRAYGGCQTACLLFWKEAWLKSCDGPEDTSISFDLPHGSGTDGAMNCSEEVVWKATWAADRRSADGKRYFCQATELPQFTAPLPWWDIRQYVQDYSSGNLDS